MCLLYVVGHCYYFNPQCMGTGFGFRNILKPQCMGTGFGFRNTSQLQWVGVGFDLEIHCRLIFYAKYVTFLYNNF